MLQKLIDYLYLLTFGTRVFLAFVHVYLAVVSLVASVETVARVALEVFRGVTPSVVFTHRPVGHVVPTGVGQFTIDSYIPMLMTYTSSCDALCEPQKFFTRSFSEKSFSFLKFFQFLTKFYGFSTDQTLSEIPYFKEIC